MDINVIRQYLWKLEQDRSFLMEQLDSMEGTELFKVIGKLIMVNEIIAELYNILD